MSVQTRGGDHIFSNPIFSKTTVLLIGKVALLERHTYHLIEICRSTCLFEWTWALLSIKPRFKKKARPRWGVYTAPHGTLLCVCHAFNTVVFRRFSCYYYTTPGGNTHRQPSACPSTSVPRDAHLCCQVSFRPYHPVVLFGKWQDGGLHGQRARTTLAHTFANTHVGIF